MVCAQKAKAPLARLLLHIIKQITAVADSAAGSEGLVGVAFPVEVVVQKQEYHLVHQVVEAFQVLAEPSQAVVVGDQRALSSWVQEVEHPWAFEETAEVEQGTVAAA